MLNQIESLRRYTSILKNDFTRCQAAQTIIFPKSMIKNLFTPKVHTLLQTTKPTLHSTLDNILFYTPSINKQFYGTLKKLVDQLKYDSSPIISLTRDEIETLYKGSPSLTGACQQIGRNININKEHCQSIKITDLQQQAANICTLQHNLDSFCEDILFPTPQLVSNGPGLPHHRR